MAQAPTIAIVDDDEGVRTSLASLLRSVGYRARTYGSAQEFLAERDAEAPACLIADVQMPTMTGDMLQKALLAAGRHFPIIFMTAFPTDEVRRRVMANGAHCFLSKPSDGDTIIRCIENALARSA